MRLQMKPTSVIKADLGIEPGGKVHAFFTDACYRYMDKYVPKREGYLREQVDVETDRIIYNMPYAHYQYKGVLYVMDNGKGAYYSPDYGFWSKKGAKKHKTDIPLKHTVGGPYWDKKMWSAEKDDVIKEVQDFMDRGA